MKTGSLYDDPFDSVELFEENVVISRKDLYINMDKFESGKSNIILITGFSGSGKTTLAKELASRYKCEDYIELDILEWYWNNGIEEENLRNHVPACYDFLQSHPEYKDMEKRPTGEEYHEIYRKFIPYVINWCKKRKPAKFVIEGLQLYESLKKGESPSYLSETTVLKGTSALKSIYRAMKRNGASLKELPGYLQLYFSNNSQVEALYKAMKKAYDDESIEEDGDEEIMNEDRLITEEADPMISFFNKYGSPEMSSFMEAAVKADKVLLNKIYPFVENCFAERKNILTYKKIISTFIELNTEKLTTPGPEYLIVFGDAEKQKYYDLFQIKKEEIVESMKQVTKTSGSPSEFKYLHGNPFLALLYYILRYFTLHNDMPSVNATIGIFEIDVYWSTFTKYFPYGVIAPVMRYTIDNLSNKFTIKKEGTLFGALTKSGRSSYDMHKENIKKGTDDLCIAFLQRIKNDQNSMFRTLANLYMENHKKGNAITTRNDEYDPDSPVIDSSPSISTEIQNEVDRVVMPIIANGVDIALAEAAARMSTISITNLRMYLGKILVNERLGEVNALIESMIFLYIHTYKKSVRDIKSEYFLYWAATMFKKTNSSDPNIKRINTILDKWGNETGIYQAFRSEGSQTNYKKAIFLYMAMSIQKYT